MALNGGLSVGDTTFVDGDGVRVRDAAVSGGTLYTIANNDKVKVLAKKSCSDGYYWYRIGNITHGNKPDGWIRGDFLENSAGSGSDKDDTSIEGVTGNGPNSTITAQDIRDGIGVWKKDTKTKNHPGIKDMQSKLNSYAAYRGSDIGNCGEPDGCFGDKTAYMVRWFQGVIVFEHGYSSGYTQDGIVGKLTMRKLEDVVGHIV